MTDTAAAPELPAGALGFDENGDPVYPSSPPSPQELNTDRKTAVLEPSTSTLTVGIEMSRSTQYAAEKKSIQAHLKVALPDNAIASNPDGTFGFSPAFLAAVDAVAQQGMNVIETAAARQHGLEVASDGTTVRVMNLFPGSTATAAPAAPVAQGSFTAPAPVPGMAPAAPVAPVAPAVAPAPVMPAAPAPVAPGGFPQPGAAPAPGGQQGTATNNPLAWSNQTPEQKAAIIATIENWVASGGQDASVVNRMVAGERYPGVTVRQIAGITGGDVKVGGKTLLNNTQMGPSTRAWAQQCVAGGLNLG